MAGVLSGRLLGRFGAALAVSGGQIVPALDGILAAVHGLDKAQAAVALDVGIAVAHGVIAVSSLPHLGQGTGVSMGHTSFRWAEYGSVGLHGTVTVRIGYHLRTQMAVGRIHKDFENL